MYKTIQNPTEAIYKEKGSKFLAFAYPVSDSGEAASRLEELKKKFHDARHHCFAYVFGMKEQTFKASDDGEPTHSAGDPILGQIRAFELTNVLVVVVRYFGGIKLGVGGLVTAYKTAAERALSEAKIMEIYPVDKFSISFPYELTGELESIFNDFPLEFDKKEFTDTCHFVGRVRTVDTGQFRKRLELLYGIRFNFD